MRAILLLLLLCCSIQAASYRVSVYQPSTATYQFSETYRSQLLSSSNFGPSGIVNDVTFSSVDRVTSITEEMLNNTDIFVLSFVWGSGWSMTSNEALLVKNFVEQKGGSLILGSDCNNNYASLLAQYYGVEFYNGWASTGTTFSMTNRTVAPEITDGPFGVVNSVSWSSNATSQIINAGSSTVIDSFGMISVLAPTSTRGSIIFYSDGELSLGSQPGTGDYEKLKLNLFAYSAHGVRTIATPTVPEPATLLLFFLFLSAIGINKLF